MGSSLVPGYFRLVPRTTQNQPGTILQPSWNQPTAIAEPTRNRPGTKERILSCNVVEGGLWHHCCGVVWYSLSGADGMNSLRRVFAVVYLVCFWHVGDCSYGTCLSHRETPFHWRCWANAGSTMAHSQKHGTWTGLNMCKCARSHRSGVLCVCPPPPCTATTCT